MTMIKDKNLRLYEALAHEVAMDASRRKLTDAQRRESRDLLSFAKSSISELERSMRRMSHGRSAVKLS
jgi:hypothetical protein